MPTAHRRLRLVELQKAPPAPIDISRYDWVDDDGRQIHVLEVAPERGVIRALVSFRAGARVPIHSHEVAEDTLVLQGGLELEGDVTGTYGEGNVFWTPAGSSHGGRVHEGQDCVCYVVLWSSPDGD